MTDNKNSNVPSKPPDKPQKKNFNKIRLDNANSPKETNDYSLADEIRLLQTKIIELESCQNKLTKQVEKSDLELEHERRKVTHLERQLEFAKSNQFIFKNIEDPSKNAKCWETPGEGKIVEVSDKSVQTWNGVLCRACLDTEKLRSQLEKTKGEYSDCVLIKRNTMDKISKTFQSLKGVDI